MRKWLQELRARIHQVLRAHLTPESIAQAVGVGVFIGALPIYGVHIFVCVAVARWLKLNQALVYGAANISNPLFAPFLITGQIALGELIRKGTFTPGVTIGEASFWEMLTTGGDLFVSCMLGSVVSALVLAPSLAYVALLAARRWKRPPPDDMAGTRAAEG